QRLALRTAATVGNGLKSAAHRRPGRIGKNRTEKIRRQVNAAHPGRLTLRHPRNGRTDGRRNTTGATAHPAIHALLRQRLNNDSVSHPAPSAAAVLSTSSGCSAAHSSACVAVPAVFVQYW